MTKKLMPGLILLISLLSTSATMAQESIRVKCDRFTMDVPSTNVVCYQIDDNVPVEDPEISQESENDGDGQSFDPALLANAQIANTSIVFSDYESTTSAIAPQVTFYLIDDLGKTAFDLLDMGWELSDVMNNIKSGYSTAEAEYMNIPFLPFQVNERSVNILPKQLDFTDGTGIRTIVDFYDTIVAATSTSNLYYSFQGISSDGSYYISAVFPLQSNSLNGQNSGSVDWNSVTGNDFYPSLEQLDYYIRSIVID